MEAPFDRISNLAKTQVTKLRWVIGLRGVLGIAVGILILAWPGISLYALTILVGAYALASGIVELGFSFRPEAKGQRGWLAFSGLLGVGFGVVVLVWPSISALALLYVIGAYAIMIGILAIGGAFQLPLDGRDSALLGLSGLVAILFGVVMFAKPGAGALVTLALIAAFALVTGVTQLVVAIGGEWLVERRAKQLFAPKDMPKHTPQPSH
jgi:uncharacterized membrane protein HdeD (DUF308 family)